MMRNVKRLPTFAIGLTLVAAPAYSDTTDVYCSNSQDSSAWYWLGDGNYHISGEYKRFMYYGKIYWGFSVTERDYQKAKNACYEDWYPQPADSRFSDWRVFLIKKANKILELAPGFVSEQRFNASRLGLSRCFLPYIKCHYESKRYDPRDYVPPKQVCTADRTDLPELITIIKDLRSRYRKWSEIYSPSSSSPLSDSPCAP